MRTNLLTKILSAATVVAMLSASSSVFAQVKVGTNPTTIGSNSNLEVEATNNKKVIVHKDDGTVVIENVPQAAAEDFTLKIDASGNVKKTKTETSIDTSGVAKLIGTLGPDRNLYRRCYYDINLPTITSTGNYNIPNAIPIGSQNGVPRTLVTNLYGTVAERNNTTLQYRFFPLGYTVASPTNPDATSLLLVAAAVGENGNIGFIWRNYSGFGGGISAIPNVCVEYAVAKAQDTNKGNP